MLWEICGIAVCALQRAGFAQLWTKRNHPDEPLQIDPSHVRSWLLSTFEAFLSCPNNCSYVELPSYLALDANAITGTVASNISALAQLR